MLLDGVYLRVRGLYGRQLKLIVTDGCAGLHAALDAGYPHVPRRRCWGHKPRNVANSLKRGRQQDCPARARAICQAETRRAAVETYWAWAQRWRSEAPKVVACLERDVEALLNFLLHTTLHATMAETV